MEHPQPAPATRRPRLALLALAALALAAACGGAASGSGVASLGSTTTTKASGNASNGGPAKFNPDDALKLSQCMRTHGVPNFPELGEVEVAPAILIFAIVVTFVYLVLVAQYESFLLPLAVILSLPVGVFGSFYFLQVMGLANDVYAQIGLIMLVGLLGKNAILIIEFAVQRRHEGIPLDEASIEGGKLRFRPI